MVRSQIDVPVTRDHDCIGVDWTVHEGRELAGGHGVPEEAYVPTEARVAARSLGEVYAPVLHPEALGILETMADLRDGKADGFVFPGRKRGRALSNMAMLKLLERMERDDLTVHGFRSTFRDWAAERTNYPREVAEAALAHVIPDKVEAAYRRGDLFEKRRRLMNEWARFCAKAKAGGKVVPMRAKARGR